jgi:hypothetical protein
MADYDYDYPYRCLSLSAFESTSLDIERWSCGWIICEDLLIWRLVTASGRDDDQQERASGKVTPSTWTSVHSNLVMASWAIQAGLKTADKSLKVDLKLDPMVWI